MPLNAAIFNNLNTNAPYQLSELVNPTNIAKRKYDLAGLAQQQQMRDAQIQEIQDKKVRQQKLADLINNSDFTPEQKAALQLAPEQAVTQILKAKEQQGIELSKLALEVRDAGFTYGTPEFAAEMKRRYENTLTSNSKDRGDYAVPVYGKNGEILSFNTRDPQNPLSLPPNPLGSGNAIGAQYSPEVKRSLAGATATGTGEAERAMNMAGITDVITKAENILTGKETGTKPTGSGIGQAVDYVAGMAGISPAGADEATQLKALGGALTSKMPRMQGPQSDKDTQLYREMAASIGDGTKPRSQRLQALKIVRSLWSKYESQQPTDTSQPKRIKFDAQGNQVN